MSVPKLSDGLVEWASQAGISFSESKFDSAAILSSGGGEYRYYIRHDVDNPGWFKVTRASRAQSERLLFSANGLDVVEKYFCATFGADIRSVRGLPFLEFPTEPHDIANGYSLRRPSPGVLELAMSGGKEIARARDGVVYSTIFVMMSYWLEFSFSELKAAFSDTGGRPVFPIDLGSRQPGIGGGG